MLFFSFNFSQIEVGSWNIVNLRYKLNDKWSAFSEAQIRSLKYYDHFHYHEIKGGINYSFVPNIIVSIAGGNYQTYKEGGNFVLPKNNDEIRLWPQLILIQNIGKLKIEQRYRTEFRFTSNGYRNRFRYRLGVSLTLGKEKNGYKPFQIYANNELFFTNLEPYFERNRLAFGLFYKINKTMSIQCGYLHQFDYKINDETGRDFIQLGVYYEVSKSSNPTH
jgi:long-subunit fatty acid transport protein